MPLSHIGVPGFKSCLCFLPHLCRCAWEAPSAYLRVPAIRVGDPNGDTGSWLWLGPDLVIAGVLGK